MVEESGGPGRIKPLAGHGIVLRGKRVAGGRVGGGDWWARIPPRKLADIVSQKQKSAVDEAGGGGSETRGGLSKDSGPRRRREA